MNGAAQGTCAGPPGRAACLAARWAGCPGGRPAGARPGGRPGRATRQRQTGKLPGGSQDRVGRPGGRVGRARRVGRLGELPGSAGRVSRLGGAQTG